MEVSGGGDVTAVGEIPSSVKILVIAGDGFKHINLRVKNSDTVVVLVGSGNTIGTVYGVREQKQLVQIGGRKKEAKAEQATYEEINLWDKHQNEKI